MTDYRKEIDNLQLRLEELLRRQEHFGTEIRGIQSRIDELRNLIRQEAEKPAEVQETVPEPVIELIEKPVVEIPVVAEAPVQEAPKPQPQPPTQPQPEAVRQPETVARPADSGSGLEKYIGQNLIPVIGIIITVIGVGIGAKYAIDHQMVTPLTRILLGYVMGAGLLFFAIRLKKKYHEFSAVLLSGSMAIFYFITFFAYSFYGLIPLPAAFLMMVVITGATVYAAIHYNLQIIAHVGLVGAYAVPFLLSNGSGRIGIFFSYMAVINIGILIVSFFRNWKSLYYVSFGLSWLIYVLWFVASYRETHFVLGMVFLAVFFVIFYATNLAYKLIKQEAFDEIDGMLILFNSLIFYGMGMTLLATHYSHFNPNYMSGPASALGWFTLLNALIHFAISGMMYLRKAGDHSLFYLSMGLGLCFLTVFIPVKLGGNWITLSWIMEGGLLFWVGRTQGAKLYERFSHPVMLLAFISLGINYFGSDKGTPFWNVDLLTSLLFAGVLLSVYRLSKNERYTAAYAGNEGMLYLTDNFVYTMLLVVSFFAIQVEISSFWSKAYDQSVELALNKDYFVESGDQVLKSMAIISNVLYGLLFLSVMAYSRRKRQNTEEFNIMFMLVFFLCIFLFLTVGLYQLNFMHLKYLFNHEGSGLYTYANGQHSLYYRGPWLIGARYVSYAIVAFALFQLMKFIRQQMPWKSMVVVSEYVLHTVIIWCCSAELVNWMHSVNSAQAYKLALSIFAGLYALFMIVLGIWQQKSYLRIGAISLFGITLLKLFFYDIRQMDTIFKTVILISLGVLLLITAFLYNKYKGRMFD